VIGCLLWGASVRGAVSSEDVVRFGLPPISQLQPSPDGHWIGAIAGGTPSGWLVWNLEMPSAPPRLVPGSFSGFLWGGTGSITLLDSSLTRLGGWHLPDPHSDGVPWTLSPSLRWARPLRPHPPRSDGLLLEGLDSRSVLRPTANRPLDVFRVPSSGGPPERVARNPGSIVTWIADASGALRAGLDVQGTQQRLVTFPGGRMDRGVVRMRFDLKRDAAFVLGIAADGSRLWFSARGDQNTRGVHELVVANPDPPRRIFSDSRYDFDGRGVIHGNNLVGLVSEQDRPKTHWLDPRWTPTPDSMGFPVALLGDGDRALFWRPEGSGLGTASIVTRPDLSKKPQPLSPFGGTRPAEPFPTEVLQWTARDGVSLEGYLSLPREGTSGATPLVVLVHGGPWERDYSINPPEADFLNGRGWAVLRVNYRGSDGFGDPFQQRGAGHWRGAARDLIDATRAVLQSASLDSQRVTICGSSFGGFLSALTLTEPDSPFRAAATINGLFDVNAWLGDRRSSLLPRDRIRARHRLRGSRQPDVESMRVDAKRVSAPLWIGHALDDDWVPPQHSRHFEDSLRRHSKVYESVYWSDGGHRLGTPEQRASRWDQAERFLRRKTYP